MTQPGRRRPAPRSGLPTRRGELDPSFLATHRLPLEQAVDGYDAFKHKRDGCVRAVFAP